MSAATAQDWLDGGWMHTYTGKRFYPLTPRLEDVDLRDIAHALSMICRFGGHCETHYSVAQHSVLVSMHCDEASWGLLHDAAEAYVGDLIRPIKHQMGMERYRQAEDRVMNVICTRFGLPLRMPQSVKLADRIVLATEGRDVRSLAGLDGELPGPLLDKIVPWTARHAEWAFLDRAKQLGIQ
jgi:5'-nucleotidase